MLNDKETGYTNAEDSDTPDLTEITNELAGEKQDIVLQQVENFGEEDISKKFQDLIINDVLSSLAIDDKLRGKTMNTILQEISTDIHAEKNAKKQQAKKEALLVLCTRNAIPMNQRFEYLPAKKKLQCLALYHAFMSKPPLLSMGGIGERLRQPGKQSTWESRYQYWLTYCLEHIHTKFKDKQSGGIADYLTQLAKKDTSITSEQIDEYIQELEALKNHLDSMKPKEGNVGGFIFAVIIGIGIGIFAKHKYDEFMTPSIQRGLPIGEIQLMDPEVLSLMTTAKQPFRQTGERTDKQFDSSADSGLIKSVKDAANVFQSRTIAMNMEGDVEVSFDFQNYKMSFDGKRIKVHLGSPTYRIANQTTYILDRNSEWVEVAALDQTEQELTQELKTKALDKAKRSQQVEELAKQQLAALLFNLYKIVDGRLEGVDIILESDNSPDNSPTLRN